jgi:hypothetical protein
MSKPITFKYKLAVPITAPAVSQAAKQNTPDTDRAEAGYKKSSAPAKSLLTRFGNAFMKIAEVADGVDKIRNAIEGIYKLAGAIWPIFLLIWPN